MVSLKFNEARRALFLGAHADDIEIGCGGTILRLVKEHPTIQVVWVVFSADRARAREAKSSAEAFLKGLGQYEVIVKQFKGSFFPFEGEKIKGYFEKLKAKISPDLVFTHYRDDRHQDHRVLSDLAWNTFRDHVILEYEIPKYDGDLGTPNFYVQLDEEICQKKTAHLCKFFQTQSNKHWFSSDTFMGLMRLRGIECASKAKYAEAFYSRKLLL